MYSTTIQKSDHFSKSKMMNFAFSITMLQALRLSPTCAKGVKRVPSTSLQKETSAKTSNQVGRAQSSSELKKLNCVNMRSESACHSSRSASHGASVSPKRQGNVAVSPKDKDSTTCSKSFSSKAPEDAIFSYPLLLRDPLTTYVNHKVVVIGDAAHLFRPVLI